MSVTIKRVVIFIAVVFLLIGYRLSDNGLLSYYSSGDYTVFDKYDNSVTYGTPPLLNKRGCYERLDFNGSDRDVKDFIKKAEGKVVFVEQVGDVKIYYAYSRAISGYSELAFGRVNIMIAQSGGKITVGSPLIKGSY